MQHAFDLSDTLPPTDSLDDILAVAAEVLAEYGEAPERTRIVRLAEWIVLNVGGEPHQTEVCDRPMSDEDRSKFPPSVKVITTYEKHTAHDHARKLVRVGAIFGVEDGDGEVHAIAVGSEAARAFAVAMLRSVETVEA